MSIRRILAVVAVTLASLVAALAFATPSFASTGPNTVNVSVSTVVSISGLKDVSFSNAVPGQTSNLTPAEQYTVTSNDGLGYTLDETSSANNFVGPAPSTAAAIPNTDWTISGSGSTTAGNFSITPFNPSTTTQQVYKSSSGPATDTWTENWSLAVPSTLIAGVYTEQLTYLAVGN